MSEGAMLDRNGIGYPDVLLWPQGAPEARGSEILDQPALSIHLPDDDRANGCGVIVNPGGGYRILASDHEGLQVARWLNRIGIAAFVLRYRVGPTYHSSVSLLDGLRAVRHVRAHAAEYAIDPQRIGMLGFSAGGHLTAAVGTGWDLGDADADDPIERASGRPDFLVPIYAVTNGEKRGRKADEYTKTDEMVTSDTPPTFIVHTHEDTIVPATQATLLYDALLRAQVDAELHIFNIGEHGLGLMPGDPDVAEWTALLHRWLRRHGFLTDAERVGVSGSVALDGRSMGIVWVTLIPDNELHPIARVRINRATEGRFEIEQKRGPVAGPHRLEVHHVSEQYPHVATGLYSLDDNRVHRRKIDVTAGMHLELDLSADQFEPVSD